MNDKHHKIIAFLSDKEPVKKADIVKQFQHWYHTNSAFHIGNVLHTMCKKKMIHNPKHGYYQIGENPDKGTVETNLIDLFTINPTQ